MIILSGYRLTSTILVEIYTFILNNHFCKLYVMFFNIIILNDLLVFVSIYVAMKIFFMITKT
jgi:hypothetical protein